MYQFVEIAFTVDSRRTSLSCQDTDTNEEVQPETLTTAVMASTAAGRAAVSAAKVVKPILSRDLDEAKRRVRELYRAWYREVPNTGMFDRCGSSKM